MGIRHYGVSIEVVSRLLAQQTARADVVVPRHLGHYEPLLACYSHRCLSAIQESLLSGEGKMRGWWGQVRVDAFDDLFRNDEVEI